VVAALVIDPAELYDRPSRIEDWAQDGVRRGRVLLVGAGNIGDAASAALVRAGVGTLAPGRLDVLDSDVVAVANLSRGVCFLPCDVGRPKAEALAERLRGMNPLLYVRAIVGDVRWDFGTANFGTYDVVIMATHSIASRRWINMWAHRIPGRLKALVNGGIEDLSFAVKSIIPGRTPCYSCALPDNETTDQGTVAGCNGLVGASVDAPVGTNGLMGMAAAALMANETVRILAGFEPVFAGKELRLEGHDRTVALMNEPYRATCQDHVAARPDAVLRLSYGAASTVGSVRGTVAAACAVAGDSVRLFSPLLLITALRCDCSNQVCLVPPRPQAAPISPCCSVCGNADLDRFRPETARELRSDDLSLAQYGIPDGQSLVAYVAGQRYELVPGVEDDLATAGESLSAPMSP